MHRPWIIDYQTTCLWFWLWCAKIYLPLYSSFTEILFGVPQGSILGPLVFNAYICDLFYDIDDLDIDDLSFADDNTPYSCLSDIISVPGQLKGGTDKIFDWFKKKFFKGNTDKCHLITSWKNPVGIEVANMTIMSEEKVELLGIHIDNRVNFDYHISQLCKKAGKNCML